MQRKTLPAKHFFVPVFLLILALIWGAADIGKSGAITPFSREDLLTPAAWFTPVTLIAPNKHPKAYLVNTPRMEDVFCLPDNKQCWVVGDKGIILNSKNGGDSWQLQTSGADKRLASIHFATPNQGWAVGDEGIILRTNNGGQSWLPQASSTNVSLKDVYFTNSEKGWAVGAKGTVLHTTDGGKSWQTQSNTTNTVLTSVHFTTPEQGWAVGERGTIIHTTNGGQSWQSQIIGINKNLTAVKFIFPMQGWVVGDHGTILHTSNGGKNWQLQTSNTDKNLSTVNFISPEQGWTVGEDGVILHTSDGGKNWQPQISNTSTLLTSVNFITKERGWAVNQEGSVLQTKNGGKIWKVQALGFFDAPLVAVQFVSPHIGWAVGGGGTILHTTDAGVSWQVQTSEIDTILSGVNFISSEIGWVVGHGGVILHTTDGGQRWQRLSTNLNVNLNAMQFLSPELGWIVGDEGTILHTKNGGDSWHKQTSKTDQNLHAIYFISSQLGWAVGGYGTILHTSDGGLNWDTQISNTDKYLRSVHFTSSRDGWAAGNLGTYLHTTDGGHSWFNQPIENGLTSVNGLFFHSPELGWAVGVGGITHTANGGKSWGKQFTDNAVNLNGIQFISAEVGWAVGWSGAILHTSNGGLSWTTAFSPTNQYYMQLRDKRFGNYYHWPSPFALLLLLISLLWLFISLRTASKNPSYYLPDERGGIADAPVQFLDEDKLGYAPLARGIYKLIRNVDSKPPLAIALSAPWGQGKSSVMNMLHSLLKNDNAVVQFNVWHYRDDGQILAALIEHIRAQAVPSGISLADLGFRWNLLWRRLIAPYWRWWAVVLPIGWLTAWQMGREFDLEWGAIYAHIEQQAHDLITPLSTLVGNKLANASPSIGILLLLLASPLIVKKFLAPLKSFTPAGEASLYSAAWNSFKAKLQTTSRDWEEDADIRFQFQQDFSDICHALGNRKLVLLIDDLDRCDPKQIEQIINTLNFLFSNNMPCYVVMALDWDYVKTALGLAYKDMANALHHKIKVSKGESRAEIFAENYLRKIIQLKVELPDVDVVAAFSEQALPAPEETNAIPIGKLVAKMGSDTLKIFASIKQAFSATSVHGVDNNVDKLRPQKQINLWDWTKSAGKVLCFLVKALVTEPIGGRLKRHGVNDAYRVGNLIVTVLFACLAGVLIVVTLIAVTGNAKSNPASNIELAESPTVAAADAQPSPPENVQTQSAKVTAHTSPMLVLDPQKNSAEPLFQLFIIGLGFVGIFWMFWFMRQERDSADFKQALADWKNQLSHKIKTPREWRRLENNLRFFIMLARSYDHIPVHKRWVFFVNKLKARLIAYAESKNYEPPKHFVFDEGIATRLTMADIFREGKVFDQLKIDFDGGGDPRGQLALNWLEKGDHAIDEKLTEFFELFMDRSDESAENQVKRWLHLHSFKLQLPYKIGNY